jgi:hypothetical protein
MAYPDYRHDLLTDDFDVNYVLDRYFHSGQSAVFAGAPPDAEVGLMSDIARSLFSAFKVRVHPLQIIVCGSAHLGFSPVPEKLGKPFDPNVGDIDVAVISQEIFESTWNELQSVGLDPTVRSTVSRDLFWGFISPANIRDVSEHGRHWWSAFGNLKTDRAAGVRGRLYRNFWSMQSYHRIAIYQGREKLLAEQQKLYEAGAGAEVGS